MGIELIVLGSGQDGGSPQFGAEGAVAGTRSSSSVVVRDGGVALLFDPGPDLRLQWAMLRTMRPQGPPLPTAVFVTHAHMGHYAGLLHFGTEAAATRDVPLHAPSSVLGFLRANEPWRSLFLDGRVLGKNIETHPASVGRLRVTGIPVPHRDDFGGTVAYSIAVDDQPWALYVPDIDDWSAWPDAEATIESHRVALLDATFASADEVPGRSIDEIPHPLVTDTLERFAHLAPGRQLLLTHLNHSNPLGVVASAVRRRAEDAGFRVADDGMVVAW